ncbi:hypothetical protein ACWD69_30050 [Micromonospora chokoriensis]
MIERGTGRTSGLTDWQLMDVNSMWACLQDHDTANHWKQVAGWRKVCDLAQTHLGRLHEYRRGLAAAWPPETSAASSTYLAELDELIDKVQRTHDAAAANYTALSAATQAISTTRAALRKIHEVYATKLQQKQAYDSMAADPKAVMGNRVTTPPVADGELEQLNVQARSMMFGLSGELQQAQATLQKPPAAPSQAGKDISSSDVYGGGAAPIIPPVVPVPMARNEITATPPKTKAAAAPLSIATGQGPVLGGAEAVGAPSPGSTLPSPASNSHHLGSQPGIAPQHAPVPNTSTSNQHNRGSLGRPTSSNPNGLLRGTPAEPLRVAPPGGIIGGTPGPSIRQPEGSGNPSRRVNPVGGVIGGGGAGTAPTGAAGSRPSAGRGPSGGHGISPIGGAPGIWNGGSGGPARRDGNLKESNDWDPDNPWETKRGVHPVVLPPEEDGPIDPGPAIGMGR